IIVGFGAYGIGNIQGDPVPDIVRNNLILAPQAGREIQHGSGVEPIFSNNILGQDPKFINPATGDYRLQAGSPAIDKGYPSSLTTDFAGNPRPWGATIDIGAYEYGK